MKSWIWILCLSLLTSFSPAGEPDAGGPTTNAGGGAATAKEKPPPNEIEYFYHVDQESGLRPLPTTFGPYWFEGFDLGSNNDPTITGLRASMELPRRAEWNDMRLSVSTRLSGVKSGQLLPLFNTLYRVTKLDAAEKPNTMRLERVRDAATLKEFGIEPTSVTAVLGCRVNFTVETLGNNFITPKAIERLNSKSDSFKTTIDVQTTAHTRDGLVLPHDEELETQLGVGDSVQLNGGFQFVVRKIVPHDEKRGIVGWVEFTPKRVVDKTAPTEKKPAEEKK